MTSKGAAGKSLAVRSAHHKRVALVLGSGGARGYAHIGVIEELETRGYEIVGVSGCSMGALVGGLYAAGKLKEYRDWVTGLDYFDLFRLVDVTWSPMGAIKGERVMEVIKGMLNGRTIESLPIPYTSVATDLVNQKEVWFQEGSLEEAIRASIAVPGVITPVHHRGRTLVDGGLLNPLPITPAVAWHADLILAVNVTAQNSQATLDDLMPDWNKSDKTETEPTALRDWMQRIRGRAGQLLDRLNFWDGEDADPRQDGEVSDTRWGKLDVMLQSFEITQAALSQYKVAGYPPDILIEVPRTACGGYEFHKASQLIELGRRLARDKVNEWEQLNPVHQGDLD
ncbi:patatin-like phospholipase family protein [Marinospirillum alkaliphilum]|uniref:NTE family protein n=1 Tax=Marinospirillum alkaliphilum DSM 21637 TaxID=1122209 RepID=A0A1K1U273_9GAMM|nr:patatin-like phospholipase family protein [Marinospirillum alkaliphilum]SFX06732.1 NTE family protein [Marinospirillum alkaliphilum DSM 21637]